MKIFQSSIFRAISAIAIGILLIKYPDNTVTWMTVAIGILFLLSGLISVIVYVNARRNVSEYKITDAEGHVIAGTQPTFPIVGVGSLILGALLALTPNVFITALMYIIGGILILGAINQYMSLVNARRYGKVGFGYWVFPSVILLIGLYLGWCSLLYGVTEMINSLKFHNDRRKFRQAQEAAAEESPIIEEIIEDTNSVSDALDKNLPTVEDKP